MAYDRLVDSAQLDADLTSVANAIRTKGGSSSSLVFPSGFVTAIGNIPSGGTDVWEEILNYSMTINLKDDTSFDSKTPSTSAQEIFAAINGIKENNVMIETAAVDFTQYSYIGLTIQTVNFAWLSEPTAANVPMRNFSVGRTHPNLYLRDSYTQWSVSQAACIKKSTGNYDTGNYGIPASGLGFGTNNTATATPKFRLQISKINVQANANNFPVADVEKIDSANTNISCIWKLYRAPLKGIDASMHALVRSMLYPA